MNEQNNENKQPQAFSLQELMAAIINNELDLEEIEDAIEGATTMAQLKEKKGENEQAQKWKSVAQEGVKKIQETNPELNQVCAGCGVPNRSEAKFCKRCGTQFAAAAEPNNQQENSQNKTCSNCSHVNRPQARFCAMCGKPLG